MFNLWASDPSKIPQEVPTPYDVKGAGEDFLNPPELVDYCEPSITTDDNNSKQPFGVANDEYQTQGSDGDAAIKNIRLNASIANSNSNSKFSLREDLKCETPENHESGHLQESDIKMSTAAPQTASSPEEESASKQEPSVSDATTSSKKADGANEIAPSHPNIELQVNSSKPDPTEAMIPQSKESIDQNTSEKARKDEAPVGKTAEVIEAESKNPVEFARDNSLKQNPSNSFAAEDKESPRHEEEADDDFEPPVVGVRPAVKMTPHDASDDSDTGSVVATPREEEEVRIDGAGMGCAFAVDVYEEIESRDVGDQAQVNAEALPKPSIPVQETKPVGKLNRSSTGKLPPPPSLSKQSPPPPVRTQTLKTMKSICPKKETKEEPPPKPAISVAERIKQMEEDKRRTEEEREALRKANPNAYAAFFEKKPLTSPKDKPIRKTVGSTSFQLTGEGTKSKENTEAEAKNDKLLEAEEAKTNETESDNVQKTEVSRHDKQGADKNKTEEPHDNENVTTEEEKVTTEEVKQHETEPADDENAPDFPENEKQELKKKEDNPTGEEETNEEGHQVSAAPRMETKEIDLRSTEKQDKQLPEAYDKDQMQA